MQLYKESEKAKISRNQAPMQNLAVKCLDQDSFIQNSQPDSFLSSLYTTYKYVCIWRFYSSYKAAETLNSQNSKRTLNSLPAIRWRHHNDVGMSGTTRRVLHANRVVMSSGARRVCVWRYSTGHVMCIWYLNTSMDGWVYM